MSFYLKECGASQIVQTPIICLYLKTNLHVFAIHILWGNDLESQYRKSTFKSWVFDRKLLLKVYNWNNNLKFNLLEKFWNQKIAT